MLIMRLKISTTLIFACAVATALAADDQLKLEYHGAGWLQAGRVENSFNPTPNAGNDYEKNWLGQSGGVINFKTTVDEHWEGGLGIGTVLVHLARGSRGIANKWYPFWVPFISEARFTYSGSGFAENGGFQLTLGSFGYGYSPDSKNLGQYLLRGYVYPGTIVSGFGNITGAMGRYKVGTFTNDLILNSETEDKPFYDFSVADVVTYRPHASIEIGAGVNFYRALPSNSKATSPGKDCNSNLLGVYALRGQDSPCFIVEKDTAGVAIDTVLVSLAGTKVMGRFRLDPKVWFGSPAALAKDELVLYGETAIIGVKNYPVAYDKLLRRVPLMLGFNIPTMNLFSMSLEWEYYASKISGDNLAAKNGSPVPAVDAKVNNKRDDTKWSVNASKVLAGHIAISGQVANDHMRLGGNHDEDTGVEAMRTPEDWYWTTKIAYFF